MRKLLLAIILLGFLSLQSQAQEIVGYLPSYRDASTTNIQYNKVTKIIYAFINPNTDGSLITTSVGNSDWDFNMTHFLTVKSNCASNGVKLYISIGGADGGDDRATRLYNVSGNQTSRDKLADEIVAFAISHNLAGIDVDWEFPKETVWSGALARHEALLAAIRAEINSSSNPNLKLGVAVGGEYTNSVNHLQYFNSTAVQYVDDFHIMSYDFPASYDNNHAALDDAQNSVNQWSLDKGIPKSKMYMGVPFYGRDAGRWGDSDYRVFSASNPATAYTSDQFNGYYYNGKATLEAKVDWIMAQGGKGIMIWDLGQDRTDQYSLLNVIYDRMQTACPIPQPSLGPDVGFCSGTVTLNSGVTTASGRTFTWKKDGVTVVSASTSATTYVANAGGVYTVEVTQSGCTKSDVITVTAGSSLSAAGGTRCGPGTVTLTVNNTGGTYDWWTDLTGGSKLHTGQSYTPSVTNTTTYYVQENTGSQTYDAGRLVPRTASPWAWNEGARGTGSTGLTLPKWAHKITVDQDLTLQSVSVYTSGVFIDNARLMVISTVNGTSILQQTSDIDLPANGGPHVITANFQLSPGTYYIGIYAPINAPASGTDAGIWMDHDISQPTTQAGVFSIAGTSWVNYTAGFNADPNATAHYGQLFDWKITTGVAPPCGRTPVVATVNAAASTGLTVTSGGAVCAGSNGSVTVQSSESGVSYRPYIGANTAGDAVNGTDANITLTINAASMAVGANTITIQATKTGCGTVNLTNTASITVNAGPATGLTVSAGTATICSGTNGSVNVASSESGVSYQAYIGASAVGTAVTGTGGTIALTIPSASLSTGANTISVRATKTGCTQATLTNTASITVNTSPSTGLGVSAASATICSGSNGGVNVASSQNGVSYQAYIGASAVGSAVTGTGGTIALTIPSASLSAGANTISVRATIAGCTQVTLTNTASITVNTSPTTGLAVTAASATICSGSNGGVNVALSQSGVSYQAYIGASAVGTAVTGTGGTIALTIPSASLSTGANTISVKATIAGCTEVTLTNTASITVNTSPSTGLTVTAGTSTICQGTNGTVNVAGSQSGVSYQAYLGATAAGTAVTGTGGTIALTIPAASMAAGSNTVSVKATRTGCTEVTLTNTASITVTATPNTGITLNEVTPICSGANGSVTVVSSQSGISYQAYIGASAVGSAVTGTGADITITIPSANLSNGNNTIVVKATNGSCPSVDLTDNATIAVTALPSAGLAVSGGTVCQGADGTVTVSASESGMSYQAFIGAASVGSAVTGTGSAINLTVPSASLSLGSNTISVKATGCGTVTLTNTASITVVAGPTLSLAVSGTSPICSGTNGTVSISSSENGVTYQGYIGASAAGSSVSGNGGAINLTIPSASLSAGSNTIIVKASNASCSNANLSNQATIVVNSAPSQPANFTTSSASVTQGQTAVTYTVPSDANATSYTWSYSGTGATFSSTTNTVTIDFSSTASSGTLSVTCSNDCGTSSSSRDIAVTVNPATGVLAPVELVSLGVHPNPYEESSVIEVILSSGAETTVEVYNIIGYKVETLKNSEYMNAGTHHIGLTNLPAGTYIVKLRIGEREKNVKVIKN